MKSIWVMCVAATLQLATPAAFAQGQPAPPKAGDEYEIRQSYETSGEGSDGSSSSSSGHDTLVERIVAVRPDGLELEYDLPKDASAQDRAREWKFPARVFRSSSGQMQLLNSPQLEERLEGWLKAAKWDRRICGHWIFTWNAFHIDCDPQSVIPIVQSYDLRLPDLRNGGSIKVPQARGNGTLAKRSTRPDGSTFEAVMEIDPDAVRRARAQSDVAVGEIMQKPVTLEAALRERAKASVSGTISLTFETDATGNVRRRTKVTKVQTKTPDGQTETETATETVERRLVSGLSARQAGPSRE